VIPPTLGVVALGLTSSITWGVSDFLGGVASRRAPLLGVLFGDSIERSIRSSPLVYGGVAGAIVVVVLVFAFIRSRRQNQEEKRP